MLKFKITCTLAANLRRDEVVTAHIVEKWDVADFLERACAAGHSVKVELV